MNYKETKEKVFDILKESNLSSTEMLLLAKQIELEMFRKKCNESEMLLSAGKIIDEILREKLLSK